MKKLENENSLIIINNNNNNNNINQFKNAIGYGTTLEDISQNIFTLLRQVDKENKDLIIIEGVKSEN